MKEETESIEMTTHTSWWSWGEKITVRILDTDTGAHSLEVSSRPRLGTTLIDYGRNRRNVERIAKLILPDR